MSLRHLRCLADFIDQYIKPTMTQLQYATNSGKIRFKDLWFLFQPGETIYMPLRLRQGPVSVNAAMSTPEIFQERYNLIWRVTGVGGGRQNLTHAQSRDLALRKSNPLKVNCYYIDFDGRYFCPITHTYSVVPFRGEMDISSLPFFPIRFLKNPESAIQGHLDMGKVNFNNIVSSYTHYYYSGPTLVSQPCGCPISELPQPSLHQEHVESEVIVDFKVALMRRPSWRPNILDWKPPPTDHRELQERCPIRYFSDHARTRIQRSEIDHIYDDYNIDRQRAFAFRNKEQIFAPIPSSMLSNESIIPEKDVLLLPDRVFAFVLRTRTFGKPLSQPSFK